MMKAILLDTETTGLIENRVLALSKQPEIIELYACRADLSTGAVEAEFNRLICPKDGVVPEKITTITGITTDMIVNAPRFAAVADEFTDFLAGEAVIAHNLSFDREMIEIEFARMGREVPWPGRMICTVEATIHFRGYRLNLSSLHSYLFHQEFKGAHRARSDVMALLRCASELYARGEL